MLQIFGAIAGGLTVGFVASMVRDGVTINPGAKTPETYAAIERRNNELLENIEWKISDISEGTYKDFSKGIW